MYRGLYVFLTGTSFLISGCGITYISPTVNQKAAGFDVEVLPLTVSSVKIANDSPYQPRSLPDAFRSVAGGTGLRTAGALPKIPEGAEQTRQKINERLPQQITAPRYKIGVGDVVHLVTKGSASTIEELGGLISGQEQRRGFTVRGNGTIALPDVGYVSIAGKTIEDAESAVFQALAEKRIDPAFSLEISDFNSQYVTIGGDVERGGKVAITLRPITLGEALAQAGGVKTNAAEQTAVQLYRDGSFYQVLASNLRSNADARNLTLLAGDAIYVNETFNVERAMTFYDQQIRAIGVTQKARLNAVAALEAEMTVQRSVLNETRENFAARRELNAEKRDYVYMAGEVSKQSRVALPYGEHASLADIMYEGGGFDTRTGDPAQIYVIRADAGSSDNKVTAWHLDTANIVNMTLATRMQMRPDDIIFVEEQRITKWSRAFEQAFPILIDKWINDGGASQVLP